MKKFFLLASIIAITLTLSGCGRSPVKPIVNSAKPNNNLAAIQNPQKMTHRTLSIIKPADWQEVKQGMILYYLPPEKTATDTEAEKVVVAVYSVPQNSTTSLADFMKNDLVESKKSLANLSFVTSTEAIKLGKLPAREEKYTAKIASSTIDFTQIVARNGDLLYKVQHYCVIGNCLADGIFMEMVSSFEPINATSTVK